MAEQLAVIEKLFLLQSLEMFSNGAPEGLLHLAGLAREEEYGPGEVIFRAGDQGEAFFVLVRGRVSLEDGATAEAAQEVREQQGFGLIPALDGGPEFHTARCKEECLVLRFDADEFFDHVAEDEEIVKGIIQYLAKQVRDCRQF